VAWRTGDWTETRGTHTHRLTTLPTSPLTLTSMVEVTSTKTKFPSSVMGTLFSFSSNLNRLKHGRSRSARSQSAADPERAESERGGILMRRPYC
jgi:hypothetical protein